MIFKFIYRITLVFWFLVFVNCFINGQENKTLKPDPKEVKTEPPKGSDQKAYPNRPKNDVDRKKENHPVKEVKGARPDLKRGNQARRPDIERPAGAGRPTGAGRPAGAGARRPGRTR